jgi:dolichol-phosphate mannosyltransferase
MNELSVAVAGDAPLLAVKDAVPELSVIVPCYKERDNVGPMVAKLRTALEGVRWEVIFVDDDSPDGTSAEARRLGQDDPRVRCIRRVGRRGLASAVIEGALSASARYVAVMDGDLQHDETRLPDMLALLRAGGCDLVAGSRYVEGADAAGLSSAWRHRISRLGIGLADRILAVKLTDPMSGFFMLSRETFDRLAGRLTGQGFKILLDLVLSSPQPLRVVEIPAALRSRAAGDSKLDVLVLVQFAALLLDKLTRGVVPLRFIAFGLVGTLGILVNLAVLEIGRRLGFSFSLAQTCGTIVAMGFNFQLNNRITYADQRLRGRRLWTGLAIFMVVCGVGGVANVGIATMLRQGAVGWGPAGALGAAIGVVWNYAVSATLVWRPGRR